MKDFRGAERHGHVIGTSHFQAVKAGRCHADDLERVAVERHLTADSSWTTTVFTLPEGMADHGGAQAAALVVGGAEHASEQRMYAQYVEELAADIQGVARVP